MTHRQTYKVCVDTSNKRANVTLNTMNIQCQKSEFQFILIQNQNKSEFLYLLVEIGISKFVLRGFWFLLNFSRIQVININNSQTIILDSTRLILVIIFFYDALDKQKNKINENDAFNTSFQTNWYTFIEKIFFYFVYDILMITQFRLYNMNRVKGNRFCVS